MKKLSRQDKYRQKHRELGLCRYCPNPTVAGNTLCHRCRETERKASMERDKRRRRMKLCINCGHPLCLDEIRQGFVCHPRHDCNPSRRTH